MLQWASEVLGLSLPVLQFLLAFLVSLPVSWGWRSLPTESPLLRHTYAAITGALISHYALPGTDLLLLVPIAVSYASMLLWRRRCGIITFVLAFGFLLACHVHFMSGESWKNGGIDATGALMVLTLKTISAAMNYQDGLLQDTDDTLRPAQKKYRISALPSPIAYLGYSLNCGSHLAGPVFELRDYINWTENRSIWSSKPPRYGFPALRAMLISLLCMGMYMCLSMRISHNIRFFDPPSTLSHSNTYDNWTFWKKFGYIWICGFTARWKFYFVWSISEAALILSGFGFSGWETKDGSKQAKWGRARNVNIPLVEFNGSGAQLPLHWNIHTGLWLRHYVYEPMTRNGDKARGGLAQLVATQIVTALWHGLYLGFLLFFVHSALVIAGARVIYKWQLWMSIKFEDITQNPGSWWFGKEWEQTRSWQLLKLGKKVLGWAIGFSYSSFILHYSWAGFLLLNVKDTLAAYKSMYFVGTILPVLVILLGNIVKLPQPPKSQTIEKTK